MRLISTFFAGFAVCCLLYGAGIFANSHNIDIGSTKKEGPSISCDDKKPQLVRVAAGRITVINFPFKPKEVVPGDMSFDFKQIKSDLAIKTLRPGARTNVLVYLENRRCMFELVSVPKSGDDILVVQDSKDSQFEVVPE